MPLDTWLRREMRPSLEKVLSEEHVRDGGVLHYPAVRRLLDEHAAGEADHSSKLWTLYVFQRWQVSSHG